MSTSADMYLRGVSWSWEQDGQGGEHGRATYFPDTPREITVVLPCFKDAYDLHERIERTVELERQSARAELLAEIGRIRP